MLFFSLSDYLKYQWVISHPDQLAYICSHVLPFFALIRFLVSKDVKLHEFQQTVRKKLDIDNEGDTLFFFIGNKKIEKISKYFRISLNFQREYYVYRLYS